MSSFSLFDAARPRDGASITGQEIREILKSVATASAGSVVPGNVAILIGDIRFSKVSVASRYKLTIDINGQSATIDLRSYATGNAVTPADVVTAINAAFATLGTVASVYDFEAYDSTGFVAIVAPAQEGGSIIISENYDGTDASANILGVQGRGQGMPYVVRSGAPVYGQQWLETSNGEDDSFRLYIGAPARATGMIDLGAGSGTINLTTYTSLRIKIMAGSSTYGPLTIDVRGATPSATTPEEVVAKINAAFIAAPFWPSVLEGPARLVTRYGSGKYLQIVSGPVSAPTTGSSASIEISGLATGGPLGINFLVDDAVTLLMGLPRGEAGKVFQRIPHTYVGTTYTNSFIRGVGARSGPGIGPWGPALEASKDIPSAGAVDGEKRTDKLSGIDWIYRQGQNGLSGSGWRRALPGYEYPISYDKTNEQYRLKTTTDTFVPQPLSRISHDAINGTAATNYATIDPGNTLCGVLGEALVLVDGRDFLWLDGNYTGGRTFSDTAAIYDNFLTARYRLGRTREGLRWRLVDDSNPPITTGNNQRLRPIGSNIAATSSQSASSYTAQRAYADGAGIVRYQALPTLSNTGTTATTFTIPDVSAANPIKARSFSGRLANGGAANPADDVTGAANVVTCGTWDFYDNGSGVIQGLGALAITGTINYTTGAVSITFPQISGTFDPLLLRIVYAYHQSNLLIVSADVRKDPTGEVKAAGTAAEAGVIYGATANGSSGVDTGSGFVAVVRDDGTGQIYSYSGGTPTAVGTPFIVDPPLDTTWRTLRVLYQVQGGNAVHAVFWNGSNRPCDWISKDYASPEAGLTSSQTNGGTEFDRQTSKLIAQVSYAVTGSPNETGYYTGIYAKGVLAGGGLTEKIVQLKNFQSHGGHKTSFATPIPALPPVSAVRLRDTINAVALKKGGSFILDNSSVPKPRIVTDCTAANPLVINLTGDLNNTGSSVDFDGGGATGRQITLNVDTIKVLSTRDQRYLSASIGIPDMPGFLGVPVSPGSYVCQVNTNGNYALWDLSSVLVDHGGAWNNPDNSNGNYYSATPGRGGAFNLGRVYDGSISGTTLNMAIPSNTSFGTAALVGRYWNPNTTQSGWSPFPTAPCSASTFPWQNTSTVSNNLTKTLTFNTTLPIDGVNGSWRYVVERAEVTYEISTRLLGWGATNSQATNHITVSSQGPWLTSGSTDLLPWDFSNNSQPRPFQIPVVTRVALAATQPGPFAVFEVDIYYIGPVRPTTLQLVIRAIRVGTTI